MSTLNSDAQLQIGQVAELTGLSLRTIRYYGEVGLAAPSARTAGGFRLYTEHDVSRLRVIMRMKPLGFSLDEMRDLLDLLDTLQAPDAEVVRAELMERLETFRAAVRRRCAALAEQLSIANNFAADLEQVLRGGQSTLGVGPTCTG